MITFISQIANGLNQSAVLLIATLGLLIIFGQMNVIISTFGGILLLHETKTKREMIYTVVGIILIVIGSILTVIAN